MAAKKPDPPIRIDRLRDAREENGGAVEIPPPAADHSAEGLIQLALEGDTAAVGWLRRIDSLSSLTRRFHAIANDYLRITQSIILARAARDLPTDILILMDELANAGKIGLDTPFGFYAPTTSEQHLQSADVYATQIIQTAKQRYALSEYQALVEAAYNPHAGEVNAALAALQQELAVFDEMIASATGGSRFRPRSLSDLRTMERPAIVDAEIHLRQRELAVIYATENVGKSAYVLYRSALLAAEGQHVVYVCGEGETGILDRLDAIIAAHHLDAETVEAHFHIVLDMPQLMTPAEVDELIEQTRALDEPIAMIALDTLSTAIAGLNENASEVMTGAIKSMRRIMRALDCAGIIVHHSGKDASKGPRGHSGMYGAEIRIEITREDKSDVIVLHSRKARDTGRFAPIAYELRGITLDASGDRTAVVVFPGADVPVTAPTAPKLNPTDRKMLDVLSSLACGMRHGAWIKEAERMHQIIPKTAEGAIARLSSKRMVSKDEQSGMYRVTLQLDS